MGPHILNSIPRQHTRLELDLLLTVLEVSAAIESLTCKAAGPNGLSVEIKVNEHLTPHCHMLLQVWEKIDVPFGLQKHACYQFQEGGQACMQQ